MFSSTYDSNSFLTFPSSSYPTTLPPCFIDPPDENGFANNNTFLHDPLVVPFIPTSTTHHDHAPFSEETVANLQAVADCTAMLEQDASNNGYAAVHYGSINPNFLTQKPAIAKKDRHSKIHTSQGLRDRRVRLSSDVARKFFDLQDMLEFDKPSNTLEWLFTKSENAIKELARSNKHNRCSGGDKCSCDQPHGVLDTSNEKSLAASGGDASNKGRKLKCAQREDVCVQTKRESREKARARARERTCYKMCTSTGLEERCPATANTTQILHQLMRPSIIQPEHEAACAIWPHQMPQPYPYPHQLASSESPCRDHGFNVIEESIMIKRNMKASLMSSSHNQNLVIPKEANFNNIDYHSFPYPTPNWDTNGDFNNGNSNFCGIATMNLSTFFMNQW